MASTCHIKASSGSHVFQIAGYSLTQGMGIGRCLQPSAFTVAGHDWAVVFYPDGLVDQPRSSPVIKKESRLSYSFASEGASAGYDRFMSKVEVESSGRSSTARALHGARAPREGGRGGRHRRRRRAAGRPAC
ncbi:unnamed protein product [Urochloa humidicola]